MRKSTKAFAAACALCCGSAAAQGQHGEISVWQAATPGAPRELRWTHEASGALGEQFNWLLEPQLLVNAPRHPDQGLSLARAYLAARSGAWEMRAGRQVFDWSQTDTISPADVLNPRDWSDITRVRKLAVPALSLRYSGPANVEAVLVPRQQASHLPTATWLPPASAAMLAAQQSLSHQAQYALRLSGNWQSTDWSAVWYRGHNNSPELRLAAGPQLQAHYLPQQVLALTAARQVGEANVLRLEAARQQGGYRYVASIDQEWPDANVYGILQYAGGTRPKRDGWPDFNRVLEHSVMFKLNYDPAANGRRVLEASGAYNTRQHDSLWQVSLKQRIGDAFTATVAGVLMRGKPESFWGRQRANRRATVEVAWRY